MESILPILFNTDMVRAILEGRKTATRRVVKKENVDAVLNSPARKGNPDISDKNFINLLINAPYRKGNFLYVRETYCPDYFDHVTQYGNKHAYKADYDDAVLSSDIPEPKWTPSIHMPKEAARIWLEVTDVRVEKLQNITIEGIRAEGLSSMAVHAGDMDIAMQEWQILWDSTIKKKALPFYGWDANPWVWVIEFSRCEKPGGKICTTK